MSDESPISREGIGGLIFLVFFFTYWIVNFKTDYSKKYYYLGYTFKIIFCVIIICVIAIYAYGSPEQKGPQYGFNSLFTNVSWINQRYLASDQSKGLAQMTDLVSKDKCKSGYTREW